MSAFLTIPKIIEFFKSDLKDSQYHSKKLIQSSYEKFQNILESDSISIGKKFLGQMVSHPLPVNVNKNIKKILWEDYRIEIPIFEWNNMKFIRLSIHIYNDEKDIDSLMNALKSIFLN